MRKRIRDSILDFAILMRWLSESDVRQLCEDAAQRIDESEAADLRGNLGESPALESDFLLGWQGAITLFDDGLGTARPATAAWTIESAIRGALYKWGL